MIFFGKPIPIYSTYSEAVTLTLKSNLEDKNFTKFLIEEQEKRQIIFNTSHTIILKNLKDSGIITLKDASKYSQLSIDNTKSLLNELIDYGYIERNGFKKYVLTEKVYYSLGDDVGYIKDKQIEYIRAKDMIIQYLKKNNSINNAKVRELCACDERKAKYYLDKMIEDALLMPKGENRYRVYLLK